MKKASDIHTMHKGYRGENSWLPLLQWLRLLVLSLTRIKVSLAGIFFHKPVITSQNHILLETTTKTERIKISKLTGMKTANRFIKLGMMLLFVFFAKFATAQTGPFPFVGNDNVCLNQTKSYGVTLNVGSTYSWSITPGANNVDWILTTSTNTITVQWLKTGTYTLSVIETNSSGCASDPVQIVVTVNPLPTVTVNSTSVCAGTAATITATPGAAGTYTYVWTVPAGATDPGNVASFTSTVAGTYSVVITNTATGCVSASASGTVTVNPLPVPVATSNSPVCVDGTLALTGAPNGMTSYLWTGPNGFTSNVQNPVINNVTAAAAGTYTLTVTNSNGCTASTTVEVAVNPLPTPVITASENPVCVSNGTTTVTYTATAGGCNYTWTIPAAGGTIISGQGTNQIIVKWTTPGTMTITVTETACGTGCQGSGSLPVTVTPRPVTTPITHN
jgi:hypothetical protein